MATKATEETDEVTTMSTLMGNREIVVDHIEEVPDPQGDTNFLIVRMNTTLEDFTYGNPNIHYKLEAGKRYRMPRHIAQYLDDLEYVWH